MCDLRPVMKTKSIRLLTLCSAVLAGLAVQVVQGQAFDVTVSVHADPYLAGMPEGSPDGAGNAGPEFSPTLVAGAGIGPGSRLSWSATGIASCGWPWSCGPDGANGTTHHGAGAYNGIGDAVAPWVSLVGVFLGSEQPDLTPAPETLDFSVPGAVDYLTLSPGLKQVFFMGDGLASGSVEQTVVVPAGASRLYLGTVDQYGRWDGWGEFQVSITAVVPEPGVTMGVAVLGCLALAACRWSQRGRA
jgi:hypothetical protein